MPAEHNKRIMTGIMDALARGDGAPFVDAMAEDFVWRLFGDHPWSGTYRGKKEVQTRLLGPLHAQFASRYTNTADHIFADGDHVIVECRGEVTTKRGEPYNNSYCFVIRMADGKMRELREYMDTALVASALEPPAREDGKAPS